MPATPSSAKIAAPPGRPLLVATQRSHEVRDDFTPGQVFDMVKAIPSIQGASDYVEPTLQTVLDGLRSPTTVSPT
jgi:hypothetical protein